MSASKIIFWICITLLTVQFGGAGITKLTGAWSARFDYWGYPPGLTYAVGSLEVVGVAGLFVPQTRRWAILILSLVMVGAAYTHIANAEYPRVIHNVIVTGLLVLVWRLPRSRNYFLPF